MNISGSSSSDMMALMREKTQQRFSNADQDSSGGLNLSEFQTLGQQMQANGSASAAGTSANDAAQAIFTALDTDSDGSVTESEMEAGRPKGPPPGPPPGGGSLSSEMLATLLASQEGDESSITDADSRQMPPSGGGMTREGEDGGTAANAMVQRLMAAFSHLAGGQSAESAVSNLALSA